MGFEDLFIYIYRCLPFCFFGFNGPGNNWLDTVHALIYDIMADEKTVAGSL